MNEHTGACWSGSKWMRTETDTSRGSVADRARKSWATQDAGCSRVIRVNRQVASSDSAISRGACTTPHSLRGDTTTVVTASAGELVEEYGAVAVRIPPLDDANSLKLLRVVAGLDDPADPCAASGPTAEASRFSVHDRVREAVLAQVRPTGDAAEAVAATRAIVRLSAARRRVAASAAFRPDAPGRAMRGPARGRGRARCWGVGLRRRGSR